MTITTDGNTWKLGKDFIDAEIGKKVCRGELAYKGSNGNVYKKIILSNYSVDITRLALEKAAQNVTITKIDLVNI